MAVYFPRWAIACTTCEAYVFRESGEVQRQPDGTPEPRGKMPTPCHKCPKVPKWERDRNPGDWQHLRTKAQELTPENRKAWAFYQRMKATNWTHPAALDPIVQWFAGPLREVEDQFTRDQAERAYQSQAATLDTLIKHLLRR